MTGDEFHLALNRHGLTPSEFAEEFGVSVKTVYDWSYRSGVPRWAQRLVLILDQHGRAILRPPTQEKRWNPTSCPICKHGS